MIGQRPFHSGSLRCALALTVGVFSVPACSSNGGGSNTSAPDPARGGSAFGGTSFVGGTSSAAGASLGGAAGTSHAVSEGGTIASPAVQGGTVSLGGAGGAAVGGGGATAGVAGAATGGAGAGSPGSSGMSGQGGRTLPDPGTEGDGDFEVGPTYTTQPDLTDRGARKGKSFQFSMALADSKIFDGKDATLDRSKPVNATRSISVYVPDAYRDGTQAPVLVIQDGPGELNLVRNALDNLTVATDPARRLPAFVAVAVQNGGNDAQGSERGLEYDTMSDRYARFIDQEVLPAVEQNSSVKSAYPSLRFTKDAQGRAALGCSSGGAAALSMGWFRPELFSRIITYSGTFVDQQDSDAAEEALYPLGAWEYHSSKSLIANSAKKELRIFLNVNESDLRSTDAESTHHNWVMANRRTAAALKAKGYHYRFVFGRGRGHCDGGVKSATLADALIWVWRGYQPSGE